MRSPTEIKLLTWNINAVRMHENELFDLIDSNKQDVTILNETRAYVEPRMARNWAGARV